MALLPEQKADIIRKFGKNEADSGSSEVQVALLTERIRQLTQHMQANKHDHHTRRGLLKLVGQRRRLLNYIKQKNVDRYRKIIAELGLRK